jgi:phosphomannomutase
MTSGEPALLMDRARAWIAADPDPETRAELARLLASADAGDAEAVADVTARFAGRLQFGTAGLRGPLGAGPMRMNRLVVRQAAAGLMRYLGDGATVVIGYDARHKSDVFALDTAGVVTAAGGQALLLPGPLPTPLLAFAVRHLVADAGVMVTASHNPPADNGYKVYLGDGAQIVPPVDAAIATAIEEAAAAPIAVASEGWVELGHEVIDAYLDAATTTLAPLLHDSARSLRIVYTAMHGVGRDVVLELLRRTGFGDVHLVAAQAEPDPDFPTVAFPNPEEPGALDLALAEAVRVGADVVLANDPDADRLAAAVPDPETDGWRALTGNEVGALLADHVLATSSGPDRLVVTTIVSSRLLSKQARVAGAHYAETLTGFKWIVRAASDRPDLRFVFGYEEALGYAVCDLVRDKDGITAAVAFVSLTAGGKASGVTVHDRLASIAAEHGLHATAQVTIPGFGFVDRLRQEPPTALAGRPVVEVVDLLEGKELPPTDGLVFHLDDGARVVVRPSGTEPKTKAYLEVIRAPEEPYTDARRVAAVDLERLAADLRLLVDPPASPSGG